MQYGVPNDNIHIFTDLHFNAGGITNGTAPAMMLSQGSLFVLRDIFFPAIRKSEAARAAPEPLANAIGGRFKNMAPEQAGEMSAIFADRIPYIELTDTSPEVSPIEIKDFTEAGSLQLSNGVHSFRPAGRTYERTVDRYLVAFSVAAESLSGSVNADPSLNAIETNEKGVQVLFQVEPRGCGHCGVCGLCALCAEINYGSASAAAVAIAAIMQAPTPFRGFSSGSPEPPSSQVGGAINKRNADAIKERLDSLFDIPDLAAGKRSRRGKPQ